MKRLISEHFKIDGTPKRKLTKEEAEKEAKLRDYDSYQCSFCKAYHVGHPRERYIA